MKNKPVFIQILILLSLAIAWSVLADDAAIQTPAKYKEEEAVLANLYQDRYIVVLSIMENYDDAVVLAMAASYKLGIRFDHENKWYSTRKRIRYSQDIKDKLYKGAYHPRRYEGEYISLENSDYYKGFPRGYIIVVAGIYGDKKSAAKALARIRKSYRYAYVQKTVMWMGYIDADGANNE